MVGEKRGVPQAEALGSAWGALWAHIMGPASSSPQLLSLSLESTLPPLRSFLSQC